MLDFRVTPAIRRAPSVRLLLWAISSFRMPPNSSRPLCQSRLASSRGTGCLGQRAHRLQWRWLSGPLADELRPARHQDNRYRSTPDMVGGTRRILSADSSGHRRCACHGLHERDHHRGSFTTRNSWIAGAGASDELAEQVKDSTPEWAAEICWLDAEAIRGAARLLCEGNNSAIQWGLCMDQQLSACS